MGLNSQFRDRHRWLLPFFLLTWGHMLAETYSFMNTGWDASVLSLHTLFQVFAWPCYSLLYLLPALAVTAIAKRLLPRRPLLVALLALVTTSALLLFIYADSLIFEMYAFHFNGFILNLLLTPGGLDSLESSTATYLSISLIVLRIAGLQLLFAAAGIYLARKRPLWSVRPAWIGTMALLLFVVQGVAYGFGDLTYNGPVLASARAWPFFRPVRFRSLAEQAGFQRQQRFDHAARIDSGRLQYPAQPVSFEPVARPPNIVWLVAESLRWDQLTPDIMPETWQFAQRAQHFTQHYSSGNGTREALFGMFYGLYGAYWRPFLTAQRGPLLIDRLQELDYQLDLRTSAEFSYPEFDKTLFAAVPRENLTEADQDLPPWRRDQDNASELLAFLDRRSEQRPFMSFFFLESTHARYSFPESSAAIHPYLQKVDYTEMDPDTLAPEIEAFKNRYSNAAHWIDSQLGRIYRGLEARGLLDSTIVIVTGDHGEEFLENGAWGHNSSFVQEQTRVPLVVWIPGKTPAVINRPTSHLDIATTLLQTLGALNPVGDYSQGRHLFDERSRPYLAISDWHSIGIVTPDLKYRIPYLNRGLDFWSPTDPGDRSLPDNEAQRLIAANQKFILDAIANCSRFFRRGGNGQEPMASEQTRVARDAADGNSASPSTAKWKGDYGPASTAGNVARP